MKTPLKWEFQSELIYHISPNTTQTHYLFNLPCHGCDDSPLEKHIITQYLLKFNFDCQNHGVQY